MSSKYYFLERGKVLKEADLRSKFGGTFFKFIYRKKDGARRLAVGKIVLDGRNEEYTTYWDTKKKSYRRFDPKTLELAKNKRGYFVNVSRTDEKLYALGGAK